jgi:hypothetical protein
MPAPGKDLPPAASPVLTSLPAPRDAPAMQALQKQVYGDQKNVFKKKETYAYSRPGPRHLGSCQKGGRAPAVEGARAP